MREQDMRDGALALIDHMVQHNDNYAPAMEAYNRMFPDSKLRVPTNINTYSDIGKPL